MGRERGKFIIGVSGTHTSIVVSGLFTPRAGHPRFRFRRLHCENMGR